MSLPSFTFSKVRSNYLDVVKFDMGLHTLPVDHEFLFDLLNGNKMIKRR